MGDRVASGVILLLATARNALRAPLSAQPAVAAAVANDTAPEAAGSTL